MCVSYRRGCDLVVHCCPPPPSISGCVPVLSRVLLCVYVCLFDFAPFFKSGGTGGAPRHGTQAGGSTIPRPDAGAVDHHRDGEQQQGRGGGYQGELLQSPSSAWLLSLIRLSSRGTPPQQLCRSVVPPNDRIVDVDTMIASHKDVVGYCPGLSYPVRPVRPPAHTNTHSPSYVVHSRE